MHLLTIEVGRGGGGGGRWGGELHYTIALGERVSRRDKAGASVHLSTGTAYSFDVGIG